MFNVRLLSWLLATLCAVSTAGAQVSVALPLDGYYRPGRYMPVAVAVSPSALPPGAHLTLWADGALTTQLPLAADRSQVIVPWLPLRAGVQEMTWAATDSPAQVLPHPLHLLEEDQRLVGQTIDAPELAAMLFPGARVVPVRLDATNALPGSPAAWNTLDAVILDAAGAAQLDQLRLGSLLAGGVTIAVKADAAPDTRWPWQRQGGCWVLRPNLAGPQSAAFNDLAYLPTYSWAPGWPGSLRRALVGSAAVLFLLVLLLSLWRSRWAVVGIALLSIASAGAVAWWRHRQSPLLQASGQIIVSCPRFVQSDRWSYQTTLDPIDSGFPWTDFIYPIFATPRQCQDTFMSLHCRPNGEPYLFTYHLPAPMRLAFLSRSIDTLGINPSPAQPITSPLRQMARELYLRPGGQLLGQSLPLSLSEDNLLWPTVYIEEK